MYFGSHKMGTLDILLNLFPNMKKNDLLSKEAQSLYKLWSDASCKVSDTIFTRPLNLSIDNVVGMQKKGLVDYDGNKIEITSNGVDLIKKIILDEDDFSISYHRK